MVFNGDGVGDGNSFSLFEVWHKLRVTMGFATDEARPSGRTRRDLQFIGNVLEI